MTMDRDIYGFSEKEEEKSTGMVRRIENAFFVRIDPDRESGRHVSYVPRHGAIVLCNSMKYDAFIGKHGTKFVKIQQFGGGGRRGG
jgi:hypothetical protein